MKHKHGSHFVAFCVVCLGSILPISFRVTSLALGQLYDCPSACDVTLNDMSKCLARAANPIEWDTDNTLI